MRTQRTPTQTDPLLLPLRSPSRKNSQKMVWVPTERDIGLFVFLYLTVILALLLSCCVSSLLLSCCCRLAASVVWKQRVAAVRVRNGIAEENNQD